MTHRREEIADVAEANSWAALGVQLKHPECPIAVAMDAAAETIKQAAETGVMDLHAAKQRLGALGLRRISLANAQSAFGGCPRQQMDDEKRHDDETNFSCRLPMSMVETFAYGNSTELLPSQLAQTDSQMGFKQ